MQDLSTISLIIPTYFRPKILKNLLESIAQQSINPKTVQVLVISNFEDPKTTRVINEFSNKLYDLKYFVTGQKGCNIARNYGIRFASGQIFYFLDDDCVLDKTNQLQSILDYHNKFPEACGVGGGYKDREHKQNAAEIIYSKNQNLWLKKAANENHETHHLIGGNASFKAEVFKKGYNFNSKITFGGAEVSLTKQLYNDGHKLLYFPELSVLHDLRVSSWQILKKGFMQGKGKFTNCSPGEAKKFAGYIKNIVPRAENTIELNSKYQNFIWYMFHLMFKMGFHWNYYCSEKNISNKNIFGFLGGFNYLKNHFSYVSQNKSEQVHKNTRLVFVRSWYFMLKAWFPTRRYTRLIFIKTYWYFHAIYNVIVKKMLYGFTYRKVFYGIIYRRFIYGLLYRRLIYSKIYKKFICKRIVLPVKALYKSVSAFTNHFFRFIFYRGRSFIYPILIKVFWLPNEIKKLVYKLYRKVLRPLLIKIIWLPNEAKKLVYRSYRKVLRPLLIQIFWLPNEAKKLAFKTHRKIIRPCFIKILWLPNEMRKLAYKFSRKVIRPLLIKLYWLPNEVKKLAYRVTRKIIRPLLIKVFWLPNEIRKFFYKWGRRFYIYVLIKIYWLPNEIRKLIYRYSRKTYYLGLHLFYQSHGFFKKYLTLTAHLIRYAAVITFIRTKHFLLNLLVYKLFKKVLLKPYYMINYQLKKRSHKKAIARAK